MKESMHEASAVVDLSGTSVQTWIGEVKVKSSPVSQ